MAAAAPLAALAPWRPPAARPFMWATALDGMPADHIGAGFDRLIAALDTLITELRENGVLDEYRRLADGNEPQDT